MCHAATLPFSTALPLAVCIAADAPSAEQVMADAVKAMGGKEAIDKIKTLRALLEISVQGQQGAVGIEVESCWSRTGGRLARTKTAMADVELGSDGKVSWMKGPMGYAPLQKAQADQLKGQAGMFMLILEPQNRAKEEMTKIENAGKEMFAEMECYRLHYANKEGKEGDLFYDVATGLPAGHVRVDKNGDSKTMISDWKEEQGVKVFRTIRTEMPTQGEMTIKVTTVEINTLADSVFAVPEGAKEALENGAGAGTGTGATGATGSEPGAPAKEIKLEDLTPEQQAAAQKMVERLKSGGDVAKMKQAVNQIEPALAMINDPAKRKPIEYAIQEIKKEIAKLGG